MVKLGTSSRAGQKVAELRQLAGLTAEAAFTAAPERQTTVRDAAEQLDRFADCVFQRSWTAISV